MSAPHEIRDAFWLVWSPTGATPPRRRHATESAATAEAERLARVHIGHAFYAVQAIALRTVPDPMQRYQLESDDLPF